MTTPKLLRVTRPYATQVEFIAAEGWSIQKDGIVAVGVPHLEEGTIVRCEVSLSTGVLLLRVEGQVEGHVAPQGGREGGPKLKIRRVTPASRDFILTVLRARRASHRPLSLSLRAPVPASAGIAEAAGAAVVEVIPPAPAPPAEVSVPTTPSAYAQPATSASEPAASTAAARRTLSDRPPQVIERPQNRDALLERLRQRAQERNNTTP
jgi:hypothetical protein